MKPEDLPEKERQSIEKNTITIDPVTVTAIIGALILLPLLLTGFISQ